MVEVRRADPAEVGAIATTLARAFVDDPVWRHVLPRAHRWEADARRMMAALVTVHLREEVDVAVVGGKIAAAALWAPPRRWRIPARRYLPHLPAMFRSVGFGGLSLLGDFQRLEHAHAEHREPHWYLAVLGTDPDAQGRGLGTALIRSRLHAADERGEAGYLESSKESNVPFYRRFGFEVVGDFTFTHGGPTVWRMWRGQAGRAG